MNRNYSSPDILSDSRCDDPLHRAFPPSPSCSCPVCTAFCMRPGWWSVAEAKLILNSDFADRTMLEFSRDFSIAVISPAFRGNENQFALQNYAHQGCTFLVSGTCTLHGTGLEPLECRFCHHSRQGAGQSCHKALCRDWDTAKGRRLVRRWLTRTGFQPPSLYRYN